jgi:hypothetical protein
MNYGRLPAKLAKNLIKSLPTLEVGFLDVHKQIKSNLF